MNYLFEESDMSGGTIECFYFDSEQERFPVRPHWHYFMELILMLDGNAEMHEGEHTHLAAPGDLMLFHPKAVHSIYSADGNPVRYAVFKLDINRMNLSSSYSPKLRSIFRCAEKRQTACFFPAGSLENNDAAEIFHRCIREMEARSYGYDLVIRSEIYRLLLYILRRWQQDGFHVDSEAFVEDSRYDIDCITEYIDSNMARNLRVAEIAALCGMSYSYFARKFLAVYGKTCKEYLEDMRVYKAEELLVFTDFDLTYISQETGFSDCSHLIKSFKKRRGITPKQFRLQKKAGVA